jgi:hypothetical protein
MYSRRCLQRGRVFALPPGHVWPWVAELTLLYRAAEALLRASTTQCVGLALAMESIGDLHALPTATDIAAHVCSFEGVGVCEFEQSKRSTDDENVIAAAAVSDREVDALLTNLPSAHDVCIVPRTANAVGSSNRMHVWRRRMSDPAKRARRAARVIRHIRFVYFANVDDDSLFADYHHELVTAEVLMDRVLAARSAGMKAVHPILTSDAEEQLFVRPLRGSFTQVTPEYIRWYGRDGVRRDLPMVREDLAIELMGEYAYTYSHAMDIATNNSGALPRNDQSWLIARSRAPISCRPLHATEFRQLVKAIEAAHSVPQGDTTVVQANIEIARRAAATLGAVMDEYVEVPFHTPALAEAFSEFHRAHLQRVADASRIASLLPLPINGMLGWFTAKRARIYAEVQARLASR